MANILIVEDEVHIRNGIAKIIRDIDNRMNIYETGSVEEAEEIMNDNVIDLFLIDIQLKDGNGLDFAREIREYDMYKLTYIVFITAVPTHSIIAYNDVHCYSYLIKPFDKAQLIEQLATIINYGINKDEKDYEKLELKLRNCVYSVEQKDIVYIESKNQNISVVTINEEIEVPKASLKQIKSNLGKCFIQCHKGYIVNKNKICQLDKTDRVFILEGVEERIPIGRKYYDSVRGELG